MYKGQLMEFNVVQVKLPYDAEPYINVSTQYNNAI